MSYYPDCWAIVKINSEKHGAVYKVLASWYGGFAGADYWKLSSGILSTTLDEGVYTMPQHSGSIYHCHKDNERVSGLMSRIFDSFAREAEEPGAGFTIEIISMEEYLKAVE